MNDVITIGLDPVKSVVRIHGIPPELSTIQAPAYAASRLIRAIDDGPPGRAILVGSRRFAHRSDLVA